MSETPEGALRRLFQSDANAPDYYQRNSMYALNSLLRCPPWWPPLEEVWRIGPDFPDADCPMNAGRMAWPDAWALLQRYHAEYLEAMAKSDGRIR